MTDATFPAASPEWQIDPVFAYVPGGRLEVPFADTTAAWRHLSALVARDPLDLEAQVRRVMLASTPPMQPFAFGALLDLFLALGARGRTLRRMMLRLAAPYIETDEVKFLEAHLETGIARHALLPAGTRAVLDMAVIGNLNPVRHEKAARQSASPVEEAVSLLDHGDLQGAQALLEAHLLEEPDDELAAQELLAIYHHSRNAQDKAAMTQRLQQTHGRLPRNWG